MEFGWWLKICAFMWLVTEPLRLDAGSTLPSLKSTVVIGQVSDLCNAGVAIVPIPMSTDNYCYLIIDELDKTAVLIDAADPEAVQVNYFKSHLRW